MQSRDRARLPGPIFVNLASFMQRPIISVIDRLPRPEPRLVQEPDRIALSSPWCSYATALRKQLGNHDFALRDALRDVFSGLLGVSGVAR